MFFVLFFFILMPLKVFGFSFMACVFVSCLRSHCPTQGGVSRVFPWELYLFQVRLRSILKSLLCSAQAGSPALPCADVHVAVPAQQWALKQGQLAGRPPPSLPACL